MASRYFVYLSVYPFICNTINLFMFTYFLIFSMPCDTGQYKLFSKLHCFAFPTTFSLPCLALGFSQNACNFYAFVFALYSFCFSFLLFLFSSNVALFSFKHWKYVAPELKLTRETNTFYSFHIVQSGIMHMIFILWFRIKAVQFVI